MNSVFHVSCTLSSSSDNVIILASYRLFSPVCSLVWVKVKGAFKNRKKIKGLPFFPKDQKGTPPEVIYQNALKPIKCVLYSLTCAPKYVDGH